jgi:hypothetical protein
LIDQTTNKIIEEEVFDPFLDQTENQIEYEISTNKTKEIFSNENEDRFANENGRFTCKYCSQTFSKNIYAMSHEKKSCKKSKSNQTKTKIKEKVFDSCKGTRLIHRNEEAISNEIRRKKSRKNSYNGYLDTYGKFPIPSRSTNI